MHEHTRHTAVGEEDAGLVIGEGRENLDIAPWLAFLPAGFMFLTVLSFNIVGDTLRALTDPRPGTL